MKENNRGNFGSKFGILMAVAGSAVGLGNIWRFPYLAGENGGGAFLLIYIGLILVVGLPIVLAEYSIGKAAQAGPIKAIRRLTGKRHSPWESMGYIAVTVGYILLGFYCVLSGWVVKFFVESAFGGLVSKSPSEISSTLTVFQESVWQPIVFGLAFLVISMMIVRRGIDRGVEKWSKILMPTLFVMLILLCINSSTLSGWGRGLDFLFNPDWSEVTTRTFIDALGQMFFTLSIGMGVILTYGSYTRKGENIFKSKGLATIIDTSIAILAGVIIFPVVFSFGMEAGQGPALVFNTLPLAFAELPMGGVLASLFFLMLAIAALTSAISIHELLVTVAVEQFKISRKRAALLTTGGVAVVVAGCASWDVLFDGADFASSNVLMPLCGLITVLFAGWGMKSKVLRKTFTDNGKYSKGIYPIFLFCVRFIAPIAIALIFLSGFGFI